ncbi:unnamed protein product, partial [Adineta steineri]
MLRTLNINDLTIYTDVRDIDNSYQLNGSYLVVSLCFYTNQRRYSGKEINESLLTFTITYIRSRTFEHIDNI